MLELLNGKRVVVTGHTGFKGTWLTKILVGAGAQVLGYSRCSCKDPSLFDLSGVERHINHVKGDIRNYRHLQEVFDSFQPEPKWHIDECMEQVVRFSKVYLSTGSIEDEMNAEIRSYLDSSGNGQ